MFKKTLKTLAAATFALGCLAVSAEAGHKHGSHSVRAAHVGHGGKVAVARSHARAHGQHYGHRSHGGAVAVGIASAVAVGSAHHAGGHGSYAAGKGCGYSYSPVVAYRPVAPVAPLFAHVPACVCD
jgi:hypothetical protein